MHLPARLYTLDIARGLAATAVVFCHWQHFYFDGQTVQDSFVSSEQPFYRYFKLLYDHGQLAVPFFFLLSGFVFFWLYQDRICSGECSARKFAVLRFARLYPLHFATLLLVLVLQIIYGRLAGGYFVYPYNDLYHFCLNSLFASHWGFERGYSFNAPIWSVSIEVGLYLLFFVFAVLKLPRRIKLAVMLSGVATFFLFASGGRWIVPIMAFYIGGLTFELLTTYLRYRHRVVDVLLLTIAISAWGSVLLSTRGQYWLLTRQHNCLFFLYPITIVAIVIAELGYPSIGKRFRWIGDISYSSYLLHFPLQIICSTTAHVLGYDNRVFDSPAIFCLFFIVLIIASLGVFHYFERPAQAMLRRQFLRR